MAHFPEREKRLKADKGNVVEFAQKMGIELNQMGSDSYRGVEHDSLVITPSKNAWNWNSRSTGGYGARSFAEKYILADSNLSVVEKANKAVEMVEKADVSEGASHIKRDNFSYDKTQEANDFTKAYNYLTKVRKISPETIKRLNQVGLIKQDKEGNALFLWHNPNHSKQIVGCSVQGTEINYQKYGKRGTLKKIERNSDPKMGWSFDINTRGQAPENLVFCESAIDAISYYDSARKTGHPLKSTRIISMEGLKKNTVINYLALSQNQLHLEGKELRSVRFGVDRDDAGTNFILKMIHEQRKAQLKQASLEQTAITTADTDKDDFASFITEKMTNLGQKENKSALAKAPKFVSSQPPKSSQVKDWNDFVKNLADGELVVNQQKAKKAVTEKTGQNSVRDFDKQSEDNLSKRQKQYLASQYMSMS